MKRKSRTLTIPAATLFGCALLAVMLSGSIAAQNRITIRVFPESMIEGDHIVLGQISSVPQRSSVANRLNSVSLGYSPNIGTTRQITREQIVLAVRAAGLSESEVVINSPARVLVRRTGQSVSKLQFREAIERSVIGPLTANGIAATIIRLDLPESVEVPVGDLEIRIDAAAIHNPYARFALPVGICVNGKTVRTFASTVEIEAFADILVAASDLRAHTRIGQADARLEKRRLDKPLANYVRSVEDLRGRMLVRDVRQGSDLTADVFVESVVIKFGDPVSIQARSGAIKIIVKGEARGAGKIGDRIAVRNSQSGAILQAIVLDEGLVKVSF